MQHLHACIGCAGRSCGVSGVRWYAPSAGIVTDQQFMVRGHQRWALLRAGCCRLGKAHGIALQGRLQHTLNAVGVVGLCTWHIQCSSATVALALALALALAVPLAAVCNCPVCIITESYALHRCLQTMQASQVQALKALLQADA
jgi:hypothetical protein